jgi:tetratricopeptide (TPR) repeat protein
MSRLRVKLTISFVLCTVLFIASRVQAQVPPPVKKGELGSLFGQVIDPKGQFVPNVRIEIREMIGGSTKLTAIADSFGSFQFDNLPLGSYEVIVEYGSERTVTDASVSEGMANTDLTIVLGEPSGAAGPNESGNKDGTVSASDLMTPAKAKKYFEKAMKLFHRKDFPGSLEQVNNALQDWPHFAAALTLRGVLRIGSNQLQEAEDDFTSAINSDPGYEPAYVALAADYNLQAQFDQALRILDQSKAFATPSWQFHLERSRALTGLGSFDKALMEANTASSMCGREIPLLNLIKAQAYLAMNRTDFAIKELQAYLGNEGKGPEADKIREFVTSLRH